MTTQNDLKKGPDLFISTKKEHHFIVGVGTYCAKKSNSNATLRRDKTLRKSRRPKHQSDIGALTTFLIITKNASFYSTFAKKSSKTLTLRYVETKLYEKAVVRNTNQTSVSLFLNNNRRHFNAHFVVSRFQRVHRSKRAHAEPASIDAKRARLFHLSRDDVSTFPRGVFRGHSY